MTRVGIIGLGMLGDAVALNLLECGVDLTVYNRTPQKMLHSQQMGAKVAASPKDVAANSDMLITVVKDASAVSALSFGNDGIIHGAHHGLVVADMSTIDPSESSEMTQRFAVHDIAKIDIPVMGGPNVAISGDLTMMVSGNKMIYDRCRPVLAMIAKKIHFLGEGPGTAHLVKLAMNMQITMLALGLSEAITLLQKAGADPELFLNVLNSTYFKTGMSQGKAHNMAAGYQQQQRWHDANSNNNNNNNDHDSRDAAHDGKDSYPVTFTLANLQKDISTMIRTAESLGISLPIIKKAGDVYTDAARHGFGDLDYTGIIEYIKEINDPVGHDT